MATIELTLDEIVLLVSILQQVPVRGADNMRRVLGLIEKLESARQEVNDELS